jgi:hypothetical protein
MNNAVLLDIQRKNEINYPPSDTKTHGCRPITSLVFTFYHRQSPKDAFVNNKRAYRVATVKRGTILIVKLN